MEKTTLTKRKIDKKLIFYIVCFALPILQFLVFYVGVNFQSILLAFQKYDGQTTSFYFDNQDLWVNFKKVYEELTKTNTLLVALKNSLIVWGATSIVGTVAAVFFSYYIYKQKGTGRFFRFILFIPSILPAVLLAIVFKLFTGDVIPVLFDAPKVLEAEPNVRFTAVVFYTVWIGFGTQILLYTGTMEQISPAVIEAGQIDGVTPMKELWYIVIPEVIPTIGTFLVSGVAGAFMNQANLYNFYGQTASSDNYTLGYYMFSMVQKNTNLGYGEAFYPYASAIGLCCTLLAVPPTLLLRKFFARFEE
ncbi:MAG: sugar ABC transporter permease [Clostridia bacterium]|nr:sugar ABC transporter permease [Clostridia bacterium]